MTEFNDLSRKMAVLKQTLKVTRHNTLKKWAPMQINASSQAFQAANITDVTAAKRVILDWIIELTLMTHVFDGNEEIAGRYREKLKRVVVNDCETKTIISQALSIEPKSSSPVKFSLYISYYRIYSESDNLSHSLTSSLTTL